MTQNNLPSPYDIVVIIALQEEFDVFQEVVDVELHPETTKGLNYFRFQLPAYGGEAEVVVGLIGGMGNGEACIFTKELIDELQPKLVVNLGFSGRINDDLSLGDVVIATGSDDYLYQSKITKNDIELTGNFWRTSTSLIKQLKYLYLNHPDIIDDWSRDSIAHIRNELGESKLRSLKTEKIIAETPKIRFGSVTSGNSVIANKDFNEQVLLKRSRKFLAVDMESAGVLEAVSQKTNTLVIRGISDFADDSKKQLDETKIFRPWAMYNAVKLFTCLVKKAGKKDDPRPQTFFLGFEPRLYKCSQEELAKSIHNTIVNIYLPTQFKNIQESLAPTFSKFFSLVAFKSSDINPFESVAQKNLDGQDRGAFQINGTPGIGKTSFLSLLYWHFYNLYSRDNKSPLPVFFNLHHYNKFVTQPIFNPNTVRQQIETELRGNLAYLKRFIQCFPNQPLLIIIDGYDNYAQFKDLTFGYLNRLLKDCHHWKIVSSSRDNLTPLSVAPRISSMSLHPIGVAEPSFHEFIEAFLAITSPVCNKAKIESLKQMVKDYKLTEIDLFTLSLLHKSLNNKPLTLSNLLSSYCQDYLTQIIGLNPEHIERAAELAFTDVIRQTPLPQEEDTENIDKALSLLVDSHPIVKEYLTAYSVYTALLKIPDNPEIVKSTDKLQYIYPYWTNSFCKELIKGAELHNRQRIIQSIQLILQENDIDYRAKVYACYLAGRFVRPFHRNEALAVLTEFKYELENNTQLQEYLFLSRTLHISLILLGQDSAKSEYIQSLLSNQNIENFNRYFHLTYYGDIEIPFSARDLRGEDPLCSFPKTFERLSENLISRDNSPVFEIELHTLCSLVQHRYEKGKLAEDVRQKFVAIIDEVLKKQIPIDNELLTYVRMVRKHIEYEPFYIGGIFNDYYQIKSLKRQGWLKRGIKYGESVADHTYGAYLIALFFLPDTWEGESDYSKQEIINMLLIHDLGEAIFGDIPPDDKNPIHYQEEQEVYEELGMLGTYAQIARMQDVKKLFTKFEERHDFNAKVAKEIDILENLVQLQLYKAQGHFIKDYQDWRNKLLRQIRTLLGKEILKKLQSFYQSEYFKSQYSAKVNNE